MGQGILSDVCVSAVYTGPDTLGYTDYSFIFRTFFSEEHSTLVMWRAGRAAGNIYSVQIF